MNIEDKLEHFVDVSKQTAMQRSNALVADYKEQLDNSFEDHKAEAIRKSELAQKSAADSLQRAHRKELSHEQLKIKRELSVRSSQLKNQLFTEVLEMIAAFRKTPEYVEVLKNQIQKARTEVSDTEDMTIYIDPEDSAYLEQLSAETDTRLTVSSYSFIGGTRAVIPSKNILIDESFQSRLEEVRDHFNFNTKQ